MVVVVVVVVEEREPEGGSGGGGGGSGRGVIKLVVSVPVLKLLPLCPWSRKIFATFFWPICSDLFLFTLHYCSLAGSNARSRVELIALAFYATGPWARRQVWGPLTGLFNRKSICGIKNVFKTDIV